MDPLSLSRWQFGLTTVYHFLFVPLTLGLGWFVAYMQTRYYQTKDESWRKMTKFWGKLFLINFAIGVVTGIVQEFQFGMNWSDYSRFVGDIFGAPLAVEALMAFFLESTFLGIWIFGEGKVPEKVHLASIWLVAIGSNLSALWILLANGWMQHPVGYIINPVTGYAQLVDFFALSHQPQGLAVLLAHHRIRSGHGFLPDPGRERLPSRPQAERRSLQALVPHGCPGGPDRQCLCVPGRSYQRAVHVRDPAHEVRRDRSTLGNLRASSIFRS